MLKIWVLLGKHPTLNQKWHVEHVINNGMLLKHGRTNAEHFRGLQYPIQNIQNLN